MSAKADGLAPVGAPAPVAALIATPVSKKSARKTETTAAPVTATSFTLGGSSGPLIDYRAPVQRFRADRRSSRRALAARLATVCGRRAKSAGGAVAPGRQPAVGPRIGGAIVRSNAVFARFERCRPP